MSDPMQVVDFAYVDWRNKRRRGQDTSQIEVGVQDLPNLVLDSNSLPFLKLAVMRRYLNEYGVHSLDDENVDAPERVPLPEPPDG